MGTGRSVFDIEAFDLIGSTTILGVLYGVTFMLYSLCAWHLYLNLQKPDNQGRAKFSLGCISLLFFCTTAHLALNTRMTQMFYIDHADFPGGPLQYEQSYDPAAIPYFGAVGILELIVEAMTMVIQVRRLWIIWSGTRYAIVVTILPVLLLLSYIALYIPINIVISFVPFDQLGMSNSTGIAMVIATCGIQSAFTILVTGLIAACLLFARRQHMKITGMSETTSPYLNVVAMLVESYALEVIWSVASAISFALGDPSERMLSTNDSTIKVIAYFLIVYRVETGRGWTKQTARKLTSLQWNRGAETATDEVSDIRSPVPVPPTMTAISSPPIGHSDSAV